MLLIELKASFKQFFCSDTPAHSVNPKRSFELRRNFEIEVVNATWFWLLQVVPRLAQPGRSTFSRRGRRWDLRHLHAAFPVTSSFARSITLCASSSARAFSDEKRVSVTALPSSLALRYAIF